MKFFKYFENFQKNIKIFQKRKKRRAWLNASLRYNFFAHGHFCKKICPFIICDFILPYISKGVNTLGGYFSWILFYQGNLVHAVLDYLAFAKIFLFAVYKLISLVTLACKQDDVILLRHVECVTDRFLAVGNTNK